MLTFSHHESFVRKWPAIKFRNAKIFIPLVFFFFQVSHPNHHHKAIHVVLQRVARAMIFGGAIIILRLSVKSAHSRLSTNLHGRVIFQDLEVCALLSAHNRYLSSKKATKCLLVVTGLVQFHYMHEAMACSPCMEFVRRDVTAVFSTANKDKLGALYQISNFF